MYSYRTRSIDPLAELIEEARWVQRIEEAGREARSTRGREMDALLAALVQAQQLRRRFVAQLAAQRDQEPAVVWAEPAFEDADHPHRRRTDRKAS